MISQSVKRKPTQGISLYGLAFSFVIKQNDLTHFAISPAYKEVFNIFNIRFFILF